MCSFEHGDIIKTAKGAYISETENIDSTVSFVGYSTIGRDVNIGANTVIENSIIWDNVNIGSNLYIKDSVIASGCDIRTNLNSQIVGSDESVNCENLKICT